MDVEGLRERWELWPWLVFGHGCGSQVTKVFSTPNDNEPRVPDLKNKKVWNCYHGWLVLSEGSQFSLLDSVSFESISLPHLESSDDIIACLLSSDPSSPSSTVCLFYREAKTISFCHIHNKDRRWISACYEKDVTSLILGDYKGHEYLHMPFFCDGKLYGVTFSGLILVLIDIIEKGERVILKIKPLMQLPMPLEQSVRWLKLRRLVESCGEIFTIIVIFEERSSSERFGNEIIGVEVYKPNLSAKAWERVVSVGDRAFFSCGCGIAFSWPAANNISGGIIKRNHLYFTRGRDAHLYSYNIEEGTLSVRLPSCPSSLAPWGAPCRITAYYHCPDSPKPRRSPKLIMPQIRSINSFGEASTQSGKEVRHPDEEMEAKKKKKPESHPSNWLDFHTDVWNNIAHKLNFFAYKDFGAVNTIWRKAAPLFEVNSFVSPWLLSFQTNKGVFNVFNPKCSDRYIIQVPESLQDATLCCCKDGWLLLCKYTQAISSRKKYTQARSDQLSVYAVNPFTKNVIEYPDVSIESFSCSRFGFSGSPTSSSCVVIIVTFYGFSRGTCVNVCSSREEGWQCFVLGSYDKPEQLSKNLVFSNGGFYFINHYGEVSVLRLENRCSWSLLEGTRRNYISPYLSFLAECNGELISVFICTTGRCVGFKLNSSTLYWEKILSFGKHTLYVSRMSSFFMVAETPEMEDKIFLPSFHENGAMVSLCFRTGKYYPVSHEGSSEDHYGTREQLRSCWIRPN